MGKWFAIMDLSEDLMHKMKSYGITSIDIKQEKENMAKYWELEPKRAKFSKPVDFLFHNIPYCLNGLN